MNMYISTLMQSKCIEREQVDKPKQWKNSGWWCFVSVTHQVLVMFEGVDSSGSPPQMKCNTYITWKWVMERVGREQDRCVTQV